MQFAFGFLGVATIKRITVAVAAGEEAQVRHAVRPQGMTLRRRYHASLRFTRVVRIQVGRLMQPALLLAAIVGLGLVMTTYVFADQLLMLVATPEVIHGAAKTYLSIRILSQPAVIRRLCSPDAPIHFAAFAVVFCVSCSSESGRFLLQVILCAVAQSGLLAMKDPVSPLGAVVVMCVVNCIGDALMVGHLHLGLAGIAWATVAAQYRYGSRHRRSLYPCRAGSSERLDTHCLPLPSHRSALAVLLWCWARRPGSESPFAVARFPTVAGPPSREKFVCMRSSIAGKRLTAWEANGGRVPLPVGRFWSAVGNLFGSHIVLQQCTCWSRCPRHGTVRCVHCAVLGVDAAVFCGNAPPLRCHGVSAAIPHKARPCDRGYLTRAP